MNPRPESRIKSLEGRTTDIEASLQELSSDQAEGLKDLKQDNKALFEHVQKGFDQAHAYIQENIATKQDISRVEHELSAMESRIKDDIASIKTTQDEHGALLQQILNRLPPIGE